MTGGNTKANCHKKERDDRAAKRRSNQTDQKEKLETGPSQSKPHGSGRGKTSPQEKGIKKVKHAKRGAIPTGTSKRENSSTASKIATGAETTQTDRKGPKGGARQRKQQGH